jgi:hypothetical protein
MSAPSANRRRLHCVDVPWKNGTIDVHYVKTKNGLLFGCLSNITSSLADTNDKKALTGAIRDKLTELNFKYKLDLYEAVSKVRKAATVM